MPDFSAVKFGKLPPVHDDRTLQLANFTRPGRPQPPPECDWTKAAKPGAWGGMLNTSKTFINDCTIAAAGHMIQTWTANTGREITVSDADVLTAYKAVSNYDGTKASDGGATCLDALKYWNRQGIGGHRIEAYAQLELKNADLLREAVYVFGGAYVGFDLPLSAWLQAGGPDAPATWSFPGEGLKGAGKPGSWGNHCLCIVGYTPSNFIFISWGVRLTMTREFFEAYCDEAYAVLAKDWIDATDLAPNHIDLKRLQQDVERLKRQHETRVGTKDQAPK